MSKTTDGSALALVEVPFHGDVIDAVQDDRGVWMPLRRPCESLGVDPDRQVFKLRRKVWARTTMMVVHDTAGRKQEMLCLHLDSLPMWLATIETSRIRQDLRPKLELYQKEAAKVLADHFLGRKQPTQEVVIPDDGSFEEALLRQCQALVEQRRALAAQARQIQHVRQEIRQEVQEVKTIAQAALDVHTCNHGYYSVLAFYKRKGWGAIPVSEASKHGKALTVLCSGLGADIEKVSDPRFGTVNIYPEAILEDYFSRVRREGRG